MIDKYFFDKAIKKDKKITWDEMAPINRRINYMYQIGTDFSYAKDIRLFGMIEWLCKKLSIFYNQKQDKMVVSSNMWIRYDAFEKATGMVRNIILYGYLTYCVLYRDLTIGKFYLISYQCIYPL